MWIMLHGATEDWASGEQEYKELGKLYVNTNHVDAFYDHTILFHEKNKLKVMETAEEIRKCLTCEECDS